MLTYFVCDIQKRMMTNSVALWSVCVTVRSSSGLAGISGESGVPSSARSTV